MIFSWPPTGPHVARTIRSATRRSTSFPQSTIADKVGYAVVPGGNGEMASGYVKALAAGSQQRGGGLSLHAVGRPAPPVSLVRTMLPYTLRDPYRLSHLQVATLYRALWPAAKDYLVNLCECGQQSACVDMIMPGWQDYALSHRPDVLAVWGGAGSEGGLQKAAAEWDATTAAARRDGAEGGLSGIPEAAGLLRRPHGREARAWRCT